MRRRDFIRLGTCFGTGLAAATVVRPRAASAQSYPARPIKLVVPYPPGGAFLTLSSFLVLASYCGSSRFGAFIHRRLPRNKRGTLPSLTIFAVGMAEKRAACRPAPGL